jgi:hypothetical protein
MKISFLLILVLSQSAARQDVSTQNGVAAGNELEDAVAVEDLAELVGNKRRCDFLGPVS